MQLDLFAFPTKYGTYQTVSNTNIYIGILYIYIYIYDTRIMPWYIIGQLNTRLWNHQFWKFYKLILIATTLSITYDIGKPRSPLFGNNRAKTHKET